VVAKIWEDVRAPLKANDENTRYFWDYTDRLIAIGPDVVPFLVSEIDLADVQTYHLSAYALGQLGGPDAEAALRKAVRNSDARGGRFGIACKRYALFGLALLGRADVLELAESGQVPMHHVEMVSDLPIFAHLAMLVGHDAAPILAKQFDAYVGNPDLVDKLEDVLTALGRAGDPAIVPKLIPLLSDASPAIRGEAADAISRLGDPALCEKLMPLLASKNQAERLLVGDTLALVKPAPCYKAMVGRLEIEPDVAVRGSLYTAIAALGGEASLPVFQSFLRSKNQFDQALVVDGIGSVGSKKGLNMLRSLLPDANANTIAHALEAIATIGGEGAIDTLLATASDRRPFVANSAKEILTNLGDKRIAPRRAEDLLALVREPVGNVQLRAEIVELTEALVTLSYTEPIADLKAALAVQSDLEIKDSLTSCIRRLETLAKDGDDPAAWAAEFASPNKDVRLLAGRRLSELGTPAAVSALTARLARTDVPPDERAGILVAIGRSRTGGAAELVERHLAEPAFDAWPLRDVRAAAAYAARRIGGERMARALRASATRRDGRDWATLVYLAVLEKGAALDQLKSLRVRRLRYPEAHLGEEDPQLERIIRDVEAGRAPARFDLPPDALLAL
jgi:HEAT repeat protein